LPLGFVAGAPLLVAGLPLATMAALKAWLFARHVRAVRFSAWQLLCFVLLQPVLDAAYTWGFVRGLWYALRGRWR